MRLWWEDYHPGWMIFTLGNQHFETLNQIIQYSQSSVIKGGLAPLQVTQVHSSIHSCTHSFIHSFVHSWFCHSFFLLFYFSFVQSFVLLFIRSFMHALMRSLTHSLTHSLTRSLNTFPGSHSYLARHLACYTYFHGVVCKQQAPIILTLLYLSLLIMTLSFFL